MQITFVSNYINHHQLPFCKAMLEAGSDIDFHFIQTMPMEEKRVSMGWAVDEKSLDFVVLYYEEKERAQQLILDSDVVLFGWTEGETEELEKKRLSSGKLSFRVSERLYREGQWKFISPKGLIKKYHQHFVYKDKPVYLLCTGAYVASDFELIKSYPDKRLKWGYFPFVACKVKKDELSQTDRIKILWAGRLIDLKHPEYAIEAAKALKDKGVNFSLDIIGDGPMKQELEKRVNSLELSDKVTLKGMMKPEEVHEAMAVSHVFLFTSNYLEGWGAVVNEAMQCGCAVVASKEAGAVPFLIRDHVNGLTYRDGSLKEFLEKTTGLLQDKDMIESLGMSARETINNKWNAKNAATELIRFCKEYYDNGNPSPSLDGPMSRAEVLKAPGFLRTLKEKNHLE
ncbi:MAG: glycosyltransferase family 4 protein [Butyrivibrio sp.]|nr:glycosyltransferase family 4 protein [Butyrivibrio sp.]MBQ8030387.1 glycosyltransferase family 4 protein [Butyrivibrio sp.]MBR1643228.1 glycosyltransferase family 4 protein [Butyrivibrio sp.]